MVLRELMRSALVAAAVCCVVSPMPASAAVMSLSTGSSEPPLSTTQVHEPESVSSPHECPPSSHLQEAGTCVTVQSPRVGLDFVSVGVSVSFYCPGSHPFPYLGALSANPIWESQTVDGWTVPKAISIAGKKVEHLSYRGWFGDRGWVTVDTTVAPWAASPHVVGKYECSTMLPVI